MNGACAGLRVLDLSTHNAGTLATMILADYGAEVIRVESSTGDAGWNEPASLLLNRGKKSINLDLGTEAGRNELRRLLPTVDVLVDTMSPAEAKAKGVVYEALSPLKPDLVHCSITGYGRSGPLAEAKPDDALVMAKAGIFRDQPGWHQDGVRPIFRAGRDVSFFSGMLAVQGILAALRVRDVTGKGQHVDTSLLQSLSCRQNPKVRWLLRDGEALPSESGSGGTEVQSEKHVLPHHLDPRETNLIGMRVETKDGRWMCHSHTEPHFFPAWIEVVGMGWIWQDERFKGAPYQFPDDAARVELTNILKARMREKTADQWMQAYVANGNVCGDAVQTTQDALRHPQSVDGGWVVTLEDPRVGQVLQIGPLAKISNAPATVGAPAPIPGQHSDEILKSDLTPVPVRTPTDVDLSKPLDGVTIVEAAYYYATPFATALLAELGARIIKIEPLRGDPYRSLANAGRGDPVLNLGHNNMVRAMQGKQSISLDLKSAEGQKILRGLIEKADVFIHCFRKGVPESLGIDEASLRKINPQIVYQYGASYGSTGAYARQPAIDPIIAAYAGTTAHQAGRGNVPLTETGADPVAAAGHAAALMLGLFARDRTGQGQYVESAMIVSNIYHNFEDALSYAGKPEREEPDQFQLGMGATYRLYETAPVAPGTVLAPYVNQNPHWVFLAAQSDEDFARLCAATDRSDLANDPRFATRASRAANDAALAAALEDLFRSRPAMDWEQSLLAANVGCVVADAMSNFAFLYSDPQAKAIGLMEMTEHPSLGKYWRHAPLLRFSETPGAVTTLSEQGEYTRALLAELGYDEASMEELKTAGVVSWREDRRELAMAGS
jgi:crotonobetainyl-CoA:carnitine CoA-transferase CaiB-like acyl-CoA transferase